MNYTVEWTQRAIDQLATIWMNAPDRAAVTAAANAVEVALAQDPLVHGESRGGNRRVVIEAPLTFHYSVDDRSRVVTVSSVWRW